MHRSERTADTLKEEIAQIVGYELEDPRLTSVTVTDVRLSSDKRAARVYVTVAGDEEEHKSALAALKHAAPYVRKQLGLALNLPRTPEIHFVRDRVEEVGELIEAKRRFAITSHIRPDGDSLGSSLGLYWLLRALDKDVEVIMRDPVPHAYQQLPGAGDVRVTPAVDPSYHAVFVIECSDITRPGLIDLEKQFVINIDHHSTTALFGKINWIDSTASAVGEMIYNLCKATGVRVTKEIAECVYTALITDTGSFHYSNTTERTFKVASELVRTGVKPAKTAEAVFASYPWSRIQLMGSVMSTARRMHAT